MDAFSRKEFHAGVTISLNKKEHLSPYTHASTKKGKGNGRNTHFAKVPKKTSSDSDSNLHNQTLFGITARTHQAHHFLTANPMHFPHQQQGSDQGLSHLILPGAPPITQPVLPQLAVRLHSPHTCKSFRQPLVPFLNTKFLDVLTSLSTS